MEQTTQGAETISEERKIDGNSEEKITKVKEDFLSKLSSQRPRLAIAFSEMVVKDNIINIIVPSEALKDEIQRNQSEVLTMLSEISGVNGIIELSIEIVEKLEGFAPIKLDDKLKFLVEKNPLLNKLRKEIELDIE